MSIRHARGPYNRSTHIRNRAVFPLVVMFAVCCCLPVVSGQWLEAANQPLSSSQPGFDPKDVVRQIRSARPETSVAGYEQLSDSGEFLIDTSITCVPAREDQACPAVAFDGVNFLVVWQDGRYSSYDIYGARVTPEGVVLDSTGFVIARTPRNQYYPAVSFNGTDFLVVWQDDRDNSGWDVYGARVTPQGTVLDTVGFAISQAAGGQTELAVGFDGVDCLVAWADQRNGYYTDIYGARVTTQGMVLDTAGIVISQAEHGQDFPAVGFDGTNYIVVWEDSRIVSTSTDIYGARVTPQGTVLDSEGVAISQASSEQSQAAVAFDGTNFLVVWKDYRHGRDSADIYGARVTPQGTVLDTAGILISQAAGRQVDPAVSFDGMDYLAVWQDNRDGSVCDIYGARVTPQGTVLDTAGIVIAHAAGGRDYPAACLGGTNFLVVWQDGRYSSYDIYGTRVTPQGAVLDSTGILMSLAANEQSYPAVASDSANFLVVWEDFRNDVLTADVYGARVTPGGTVLDPSGFAISTAAGWQSVPSAAFDGSNFLVVWEDCRNGSTSDIYGARVTPGGTVFDCGSGVTQEDDQMYPSICSGSGGQMFLAYQGWAGTVGDRGYNSYRIWGKMDPSPAVAEMTKPDVRRASTDATVVRGVLRVPASSVVRGVSCVLLDISGRKVMDLHPGANDVRALAPGVYFVREARAQAQAQAQAIRKVVVTR